VNNLIEKLRDYFSRRETIDLALLFGSQARLTASPASDIDIGVLFKAPPRVLDVGLIVEELESSFHRKIDLVDLQGLESSDPLLGYQIACEGIALRADTPGIFTDFKTRAFLSYFDMRDFLEKARADLDSRIDRGDFGRPIHA
jgi:predicted nucleotidyltransferase